MCETRVRPQMSRVERLLYGASAPRAAHGVFKERPRCRRIGGVLKSVGGSVCGKRTGGQPGAGAAQKRCHGERRTMLCACPVCLRNEPIAWWGREGGAAGIEEVVLPPSRPPAARWCSATSFANVRKAAGWSSAPVLLMRCVLQWQAGVRRMR